MRTSATKRGALERRILILCGGLFGIGLIMIARMPQHIEAMEKNSEYASEFYEFADLFFETYSAIRDEYVEEVGSKQLFLGAINGMFATLDGHSSFLPPRERKNLNKDTEGEYSGVGLHITLDKNRVLTVTSPIPGGPAAKVGVMPWDRIIGIDGESTKNIRIPEAVDQLTGPAGTTVDIKVWREGEPRLLDFTIKRQKITIQSVFSKDLGDGVGYIRLAQFQEDSAKEMRQALEQFNDQDIRGVIVDLRNNSGGLLQRAVEICDMFLKKETLIVSIQGRKSSDNREYYALEPMLSSQKLIVLVNHGSASASEIFAGAIKDNHRGVIMGPEGTTTFGKGSVQTISELSHTLEFDENGDRKPSAIRLTTARYHTPSGTSIHEKGIQPDIGVALPDGHQWNLMRHGLLGEPSLIEPESENGPTSPTLEKDDPTTGAAIQDDSWPFNASDLEGGVGPMMPAGPAVTKAQPADEEKAEEKTFEDILLKEALKYMKAFLLLSARQAA